MKLYGEADLKSTRTPSTVASLCPRTPLDESSACSSLTSCLIFSPYSTVSSLVTTDLPFLTAAFAVEPLPANGSSISSPAFVDASIIASSKATGLAVWYLESCGK